MQPRQRRGAPNTEEVAGADRTAASIPSSSAWPMPGATAASAGATRLRTPTGPAARHTDAIAAAIRVGQVSEAAHQFFLLLITFDCSIAANPNRNLMANISETLHKFNETLGKLSVCTPLGT